MFNLVFKIKYLFLLFGLILISNVISYAQIDASTQNGRVRKKEFPQTIKETLAKKKIEEEKKDHQKLLKRGEEAVKLSEELDKSFSQNKELSPDDKKKLKKLEKLLKKIRGDLGGGDDKEIIKEKPSSTGEALKTLRQKTVNLFEEIKKTSRHTISAVAIKSSNFVIKIVKFLRFGS